jgi:NADPH2:quinone reductase
MKAAYITQTGPPESIQYGDLPNPQPTGTRVLVRVRAVAVNPIDTYIRSGLVKMDLPSPFIVGCDLAGVAEAVGPEVTRFEPGDRVWGSNQGLLGRQGTFAEYACVDESWLYPTPPKVTDEQAAAIAMVGITAHLGLVRDAKLQRGETVLVNGASGGVGSTVVQLAKLLGARVIATVGGTARVEAVLRLGADHVIDYKTVEVESAVKKITMGGVNVWWETGREPNFDRAVAALAPRGRMILMAGREARPPFPVGPFYVKGCSLHGFVMFSAHPDEQRDSADDLNDWLATGRLKPRIDRVMPLAETAAAHRLQEENTIGKAGTLAGKIVLKPS